MPYTLAALEAGRLTEWRAELMVRETALLTAEHRAEVDHEVCGDPTRLDGLGDAKVVAAARRAAHRLDPGAAVRRARQAETDRNVTCRPAPDTMARVGALLPVAQGVAVFAALKRYADSRTAAGDPRSRGQLMADALVERVTGQATADGVPVAVHWSSPTRPCSGPTTNPPTWRLRPGAGGLGPRPRPHRDRTPRRPGRRVAAPSVHRPGHRRRHRDGLPHPAVLRGLDQLIATRDAGVCRMPYCDAPVRHTDHALDFDAGGHTDADNGQGLCQACNIAKQAPYWQARPRPGPRHTVVTTTPTGHTYDSTAPPMPGTLRSPYPLDLVWAA